MAVPVLRVESLQSLSTSLRSQIPISAKANISSGSHRGYVFAIKASTRQAGKNQQLFLQAGLLPEDIPHSEGGSPPKINPLKIPLLITEMCLVVTPDLIKLTRIITKEIMTLWRLIMGGQIRQRWLHNCKVLPKHEWLFTQPHLWSFLYKSKTVFYLTVFSA